MDISLMPSLLKAAFEAQDAVLMSGLHGIGKSGIVEQFAKKHGFHFEPLFLSHQEVGDLIGTPNDQVDEDGVAFTTWTQPIWLKRMKEATKPCILFLDELNRAQPDVLQSALQLTLEGKLHEHDLPVWEGRKTLIVSAINPSGDYQVIELDPALLDRFLFVEVECNVQSWLKYARNIGVSNIITSFIAENPKYLHSIDQESNMGATPRSWVKLSPYIDNFENIDIDIQHPIVKGRLGETIGSLFTIFINEYSNVVKVEDVEKVVKDNPNYETIEDLGDLIGKLIIDSEAVQKTELANQLADKYFDKDDMTPFVAYLYSLEIEICVSFLKSIQKSDTDKYRKLAEFDKKINNKQLFGRIHKAANRVNEST